MIGRFVTRLVDAQAGWAKPFGEFNHRWLSALFRPIRPVKDFFNGTWLGHPVHSAVTDVPSTGSARSTARLGIPRIAWMPNLRPSAWILSASGPNPRP